MKGYISSIFQGLESHGERLGYTALHKPVWRGMSSQFLDMADYKPGKIGYWPTFSSTTKDKKMAVLFSNTGDLKYPKILMKIYLSRTNSPISHIDCIGTMRFDKQGREIKEDEYSFYPSE
jgi:hypothetical protein